MCSSVYTAKPSDEPHEGQASWCENSDEPLEWDVCIAAPFDIVFVAPLGVSGLRFFTDFIEGCLKYHTKINLWMLFNDSLDLASILRFP